jgi:hypothetical protein
VQVFGRRHDDPLHALWRPASKKRQGTKSREVGHRRCSGRWGFDGGAEFEDGCDTDRMRPVDLHPGEIGSV